MKEELAWVCAIMPDDINRNIVSLCKELNAGIGLPETVFKFPLHISLKKSFRTHDFEAVREDALALLKKHSPMGCQVSGVAIDKFDKVFQPHISLFTSGDRSDIQDMYNLLTEEDIRMDNVEFHKFVIGSSAHRDTFYTI